MKGREEMGLEGISNSCPFSFTPNPALSALLLLATQLAPPQCQAGGQTNILKTGEQEGRGGGKNCMNERKLVEAVGQGQMLGCGMKMSEC